MIDGLGSVDREEWARAFSSLAAPHEERAAKAEAAGDNATARKEYLIAYDCYHVARYPAPNSPGKLAAYRKVARQFSQSGAIFRSANGAGGDAVQGKCWRRRRVRSVSCVNRKV